MDSSLMARIDGVTQNRSPILAKAAKEYLGAFAGTKKLVRFLCNWQNIIRKEPVIEQVLQARKSFVIFYRY
jgi:hypothetical protein